MIIASYQDLSIDHLSDQRNVRSSKTKENIINKKFLNMVQLNFIYQVYLLCIMFVKRFSFIL